MNGDEKDKADKWKQGKTRWLWGQGEQGEQGGTSGDRREKARHLAPGVGRGQIGHSGQNGVAQELGKTVLKSMKKMSSFVALLK